MNVMTCPPESLISLEHRLEALLELAAVLGARNHRGEVQRDQLLAA